MPASMVLPDRLRRPTIRGVRDDDRLHGRYATDADQTRDHWPNHGLGSDDEHAGGSALHNAAQNGMTVDLAGKQTVLRFIKFNEVIQHHFTQCDFQRHRLHGCRDGQQTIGFFDSTDIQLPLFMTGNTVAFIKTDTVTGALSRAYKRCSPLAGTIGVIA